VDLPGTYSLSPHSAEEEVTRDYILQESSGLFSSPARTACGVPQDVCRRFGSGTRYLKIPA